MPIVRWPLWLVLTKLGYASKALCRCAAERARNVRVFWLLVCDELGMMLSAQGYYLLLSFSAASV